MKYLQILKSEQLNKLIPINWYRFKHKFKTDACLSVCPPVHPSVRLSVSESTAPTNITDGYVH